MKHFLLSLFLFACIALSGQTQQPWVGGLNACQFGRMDLDGDGVKDLLVFDRHGDRLLCFLNKGGVGEIQYSYTTAFDASFPKLNNWSVFVDYDGDGKEDIFTYSKGWAGIKVFRNMSTADQLDFELVIDPYLTSFQGGGMVNILATDADYPAIVDVDGDGDLDLLTFGVMGTFIEKHLNLSVERYGHRDSLVFERVDQCWGRVAESDEDNVMYLDTCLFGMGVAIDKDGFRHRGATVAVRDLNGDGLLDLLLADVDYPGLTLLINGGDAEKALMVSQTEAFPERDPVRLPSMPVPFFTDIDNDGDDDLLVSPFDPNPMASEGFESVWLYLNQGTNRHPDFHLITKSFLQEEMFDFGKGAYPVVVDWDGDGLLDIVVGTAESNALTWLKNRGTSTDPVYQIEEFPVHIEALTGLVPACYDLDGDGRQELLLGTSEGRMLLYDHDGVLLDEDFLHYDKPWSAPCFFDVDRDGAVDLVVGDATGKLTFYDGSEEFGVRSEEYWGKVDVRDYDASYYGYSVPTLFQWHDEILLAVGSESGKLFLFDSIVADADAAFHEASKRWKGMCPDMPETFGMRSAAVVADLDGDGVQEVVVGNFAGGLQQYKIHHIGIYEHHEDDEVVIFPNPVQSQLYMVAKTDDIISVTITDLYGRRYVQRPVGSSEAVLEVSDLCPGIYLLEMVLDRGVVNRIFLKR